MATSAQARQWLSQHGKLKPQPAIDWCGSLALPVAVKQFYQDVGPLDLTLEAYGNPIFLPKLASLWEFQAGYRWHGITGVAIEDWQDDWLVIGDQGGDPFIFSRASGSISFAEHGAGEWNAFPLFADLNTMAVCLGMLAAIVMEAGENFTDEQGWIQAPCLDMARLHLQAVLSISADIEGERKKARDLGNWWV